MKLVWVDLETTGLDPRADDILEIAVATSELEDPFNVKHVYHAVVYVPERYMDPFVRKMHTENGLLLESARSQTTWDDVYQNLLKLIPEAADREDTPVLAGASVHFDASFLKAAMARVASCFSHRYYDVSAVKLFCRSLGMPKIPKGEAHRAKADIDEAVAHAKLCAEWLLNWKGRDQKDALAGAYLILPGAR